MPVNACCCGAVTIPCSNCISGGSPVSVANKVQAVVATVSFSTTCYNVSGVRYFDITGGDPNGTYCLPITNVVTGCDWIVSIPSGQWPTSVVAHTLSDCSDPGTTDNVLDVYIKVHPSNSGFLQVSIVIVTDGAVQPASTFFVTVFQNPNCVNGTYSNTLGSTPTGSVALIFGGC